MERRERCACGGEIIVTGSEDVVAAVQDHQSSLAHMRYRIGMEGDRCLECGHAVDQHIYGRCWSQGCDCRQAFQ